MDSETKKRKRKNGAETKIEMDSSVEIANQVEEQSVEPNSRKDTPPRLHIMEFFIHRI